LFVDFSQAFDKAQRSKTIEILKLIKIPNKLTRLVKMTVQNTRAVDETEHGRSEKFNINTGLRLGDALSILLFKLDTRGNISTKLAQLCAYADDLVITTITPNALKEMFLTLEKEARDAGLIVNKSKAKYMKTVKGKDKIAQQYIIGQSQLKMLMNLHILKFKLIVKTR
jgi:hypothetical protein